MRGKRILVAPVAAGAVWDRHGRAGKFGAEPGSPRMLPWRPEQFHLFQPESDSDVGPAADFSEVGADTVELGENG